MSPNVHAPVVLRRGAEQDILKVVYTRILGDKGVAVICGGYCSGVLIHIAFQASRIMAVTIGTGVIR